MKLAIVGKGIVIAVCAALAASLYVAVISYVYMVFGIGTGFSSQAAALTLMLTLLGTFAIGLPVAVLTYLFSSKHMIRSPAVIVMIAMLSGIMCMLASFLLGREQGVLMLGIPAFVAVITFAVMGWYWVLKPQRVQGSDDA